MAAWRTSISTCSTTTCEPAARMPNSIRRVSSSSSWTPCARRERRRSPTSSPPRACAADTVLVFRAVGAARVDPFRLRAHRLATLARAARHPGRPRSARCSATSSSTRGGSSARDRASSRPTSALRAAVSRAGGAGYARLPSEREANAAAAPTRPERLSACSAARSPTCDAVRRAAELGGAAGRRRRSDARRARATGSARRALLGRASDGGDARCGSARLRGVATAQPCDLVAGRSGPRIELVAPINPW